MFPVGVIFSVLGLTGGIVTYFIRKSDWFAAEMAKTGPSDMAEIPESMFWACLIIFALGLLFVIISLSRGAERRKAEAANRGEYEDDYDDDDEEFDDDGEFDETFDAGSDAGCGGYAGVYEGEDEDVEYGAGFRSPGEDGMSVWAERPRAAAESWTCGVCGKTNAPQAVFCGSCGTAKRNSVIPGGR